jgi:hypothetical protein
VSVTFCIASVPELVRHHSRDLELVAPAVSITLHRHTDAAVGSLGGVQPHQEDGALAKFMVAVDERVLTLAATRTSATHRARRN